MKIKRNVIAIRPFMSPIVGHNPGELEQHRHNNLFEFFYCVKGSGIQVAGKWQRMIARGELIIIPPGVSHVFAGSNEGCFPDVLHLSQNYFTSSYTTDMESLQILECLRHFLSQHGYYFPAGPLASRCGEIMGQIFVLTKSMPPALSLQLKTLIYQLLVTIMGIPSIGEEMRSLDSHPLKNEDKIRKVLAFLEGNYAVKLKIEDVLRIAGMGRSSFSRYFFQVTGFSFCRYLNRLRLRAAAEHIQSGVPPEEAARLCGFTSRSNYYRQKKNENLSDSKLRC